MLAVCTQAARPKQPNILWIFSDDHSHNAISAYGSHLTDLAPTPNIDRIADKGVLFRNSFVCNSICGPSRAAILTGKHSHMNGFRSNGDQFDGGQQTFPRMLGKAGYQTAVIGKWHLGTEPQGFDHWEILPGQGHYYNPDFITEKGEHREQGYVTDLITDKAVFQQGLSPGSLHRAIYHRGRKSWGQRCIVLFRQRGILHAGRNKELLRAEDRYDYDDRIYAQWKAAGRRVQGIYDYCY
ncbi:Arylsulfatase [Pontiella sulfatireligans]|uniref:Arylsulfatase n=1 Tax=Pontiella sulfatireligans TaxID=2750658 RepID=A0A6C2UGF9_9BACT|nr:sulfatase S1_11 [Kiritimatiellales bacterium]VGO18943.1 Arylsulfatase [Pontiella sulfatireligans]